MTSVEIKAFSQGDLMGWGSVLQMWCTRFVWHILQPSQARGLMFISLK